MVLQSFSLGLEKSGNFILSGKWQLCNEFYARLWNYKETLLIFAHADVKALRALFSWDFSTFSSIPELTFLLLFSQPQVT